MTVTPLVSRRDLMERSRQWASRLLNGPITFFPIRHHSPACALHLAKWIEEVRPRSIIIEGPRSFDQWLPSLADESCRPPVAILSINESERGDGKTARQAAYYPLCEYSPEWVAIRHGTAIGAKVQFADAEVSDKLKYRGETEEPSDPNKVSLMVADESHWKHSQFIQALTQRMGCRDFDELWDHLFESRSAREETADFVGRLATYCDLSRSDYDEQLKTDGTLAREAIMAIVIRSEWQRLQGAATRGSILVVTGGFHTVALAETFATLTTPTNKPNPNEAAAELKNKVSAFASTHQQTQSKHWLVRYSYDQLDSLNGYASGMPNPGFYAALWEANPFVQKTTVIHPPSREPVTTKSDASAAIRTAIARIISQVARKTRGGSLPHEASVTDSITAVTMLDQLAQLRGHEIPTRNDMLDAIHACMRKQSYEFLDELDAIIRQFLTGNAVGEVPILAGLPPIVADFRHQCSTVRLPTEVVDRRKIELEIYRKPPHRQTSFFLHQLMYLGVPYAHLADGPDFALGFHLSKLKEEWQVGWSPSAEARLIEMAHHGDTVEVAAANRLEEEIRQLEQSDSARDASAAVDKLFQTCRMGLHSIATRILQLVTEHIAEDQRFFSIAYTLSKLALLMTAREPLEATRLVGLKNVLETCYQRACHLIDELSNITDEDVEPSLDGLCGIRELLAQVDDFPLDRDLLTSALIRILRLSTPFPRGEIAGAAAGLLYGLGKFSEQDVCRVVENYLDASITDTAQACGVVRGLMATARETFWCMPALLTKLDQLFEAWEEERFRTALPHLRFAFSKMAPKEIDAVAEQVASIHRVESIGSLHHPHVAETDLHFGLQTDRLMQESLEEDGL